MRERSVTGKKAALFLKHIRQAFLPFLRRNRWIGGVLFLISVEFLSFLGISLQRKDWTSWRDMEMDAKELVARSEASPYAVLDMRGEEKRTGDSSSGRPDWIRHEVLHPYLGFVNEATVSLGTGAYYGFQEVPGTWLRSASEGTFTIGILGGSLSRFFVLDGAGELRATLKRHPFFAGKNIEIVSLALPGYKQPQQLLALNYYLSLGGHLDAVVNIDGLNEIILPSYENIPKHVFPFYPRSWFFRIQAEENASIFPVIGQLSYLTQKRSEWAQRYLRSPLRFSMTGGMAWKLWDGYFLRKIARQDALLQAFDPQDEQQYIVAGPHRSYADEATMVRDIIAHWQRASLLMHYLSEGMGIQYFHFLQPTARLEGSKPLTVEESVLAFAGPFPSEELVNLGYPLLHNAGEQLRSQGVRFDNLSMVFRNTREPLYYDCCHVVPEGSKIMGRRIGEFMLENMR
ncbi:MAG: hypothetical protein Q7R81_07385 [Candidatus Peregrinibacteria bacterium]|nr:hypothetical protein [Candidatus Peregrinibacteria bacterium]